MGGEYYFKVKGKEAMQIVRDTFDRAFGTRWNSKKGWNFPEFIFSSVALDSGAPSGLKCIKEVKRGTFELSYSAFRTSKSIAYIYSVCSEVRKQLAKLGLDFHEFGNCAVGPYEKKEWVTILEQGYYRIGNESTDALDKLEKEMDEKYDPNYLKRHDFLVYLLQKRLEDFK